MDGRGGCCIARYATRGGGGAYEDAKKMEKVMLQFRPIAPKPVSTGSGSVFGSSSSDKTSSGETTTYVKIGRGKRKYTTSSTTTKRRYNGGRKRVRVTTEQNINKLNQFQQRDSRDESSGVTTTTTLSLLPESPTAGIKTPTSRSAPMWLSFKNPACAETENNNKNNYQNNYFAIGNARRVVGSGVTVERVTDTWVSGEGLGRTDEERVRTLEFDTCPGFVTEGFENKVTWTNRAYKRMVFGGSEDGEVVVWVVIKEKLPVGNYGAFTCRVKVENTCTKEIKVLPCDVWRMEGGGFAWRLDVKAALSLGR